MAPIDRIAQVLRGAISQGISDNEANLADAAAAARPDVGPALQSVFGGSGSGITGLLALIPGVGPLGAFVAGPLLEQLGNFAKFVEGVAAGWALGEFFSEALRPVWLEITHNINNAIQSEIFDPATAAMLEAKGLIGNPFGRSEAAGGNLAGDHYDLLVEAAREHPDLGIVWQLLNLQEINDNDARMMLGRHGYEQAFIEPLLALRRQLLAPADLALALLRGDIDLATAQGYASQLGMTNADLDVLIGNTGEPPGAQELMSALRRGFIDDGRFDKGIRQSRYRNEWLDVFHKLRFAPMSVSDAVNAVVQHHLTHDEGLAIATQNGLEAAHFDTLVANHGRPLSHEQMLTLYHRGQATREQVDQALHESDIKDKYSEQAFELGRRLIPERTIVSMINHGAITTAEGTTMLKHQGFNDADIASLLKLGVSERKSTSRALARGDIVALYADKLIKRVAAHDELVKLGYSAGDANELLDLADFKHKTTELRLTQRGVEATLKAGHIDAAHAKDQLIDAGMTSDDAQTLIDVWTQHKEKPAKTLSEAQILALGKKGLMSPHDVNARLLALGLVEGDCLLLMALHDILVI